MPRTQLYSPMAQINGVLCIMRAKDLGLTSADFTLAAAATKDFKVQTPVPMRVRVCVTLSAGTLTVDFDKNTTGTYAASEKSLAVTGTTEKSEVFETDATNNYMAVRLTAGGGGATIAALHVEVVGMLPEGFDMGGRYGHNALVLQTNSGLFTAAAAD